LAGARTQPRGLLRLALLRFTWLRRIPLRDPLARDILDRVGAPRRHWRGAFPTSPRDRLVSAGWMVLTSDGLL